MASEACSARVGGTVIAWSMGSYPWALIVQLRTKSTRVSIRYCTPRPRPRPRPRPSSLESDFCTNRLSRLTSHVSRRSLKCARTATATVDGRICRNTPRQSHHPPSQQSTSPPTSICSFFPKYRTSGDWLQSSSLSHRTGPRYICTSVKKDPVPFPSSPRQRARIPHSSECHRNPHHVNVNVYASMPYLQACTVYLTAKGDPCPSCTPHHGGSEGDWGGEKGWRLRLLLYLFASPPLPPKLTYRFSTSTPQE